MIITLVSSQKSFQPQVYLSSANWLTITESVMTKGQIISKRLSVFLDSSKKQTIVNICLTVRKQICSFVFSKNPRIPKSPCEIIWPLVELASLPSAVKNENLRLFFSYFPTSQDPWIMNRVVAIWYWKQDMLKATLSCHVFSQKQH